MKINQKSIALTMLALTLGLTACKKDKSAPEVKMKPVVHVIGTDRAAESTVYWKDGKQSVLGNERNATHYRYKITANADDIYTFRIGDDHMAYWKNGVAVDLTAVEKKYKIQDITIQGNDTYMTGRILHKDGTLDRYAKSAFWKNDEAPVHLDIPENSSLYRTHGIEVIGDMCYVLGSVIERGQLTPQVILWENGKATTIPNADSFGGSLRLCVANNNIFITGEDNTSRYDLVPTVWDKNGKATHYPYEEENIIVTQVITDGKDVHSVGLDYGSGGQNSLAVYWKNGKKLWTSNEDVSASATNLALDGDDLYIIGNIDGSPTLWKNGELSQLSTDQSQARAILITKEPVVE